LLSNPHGQTKQASIIKRNLPINVESEKAFGGKGFLKLWANIGGQISLYDLPSGAKCKI